jgi:hypothetical protein
MGIQVFVFTAFIFARMVYLICKNAYLILIMPVRRYTGCYGDYLAQYFSRINRVINAQLLQKDASKFIRMVFVKFAAPVLTDTFLNHHKKNTRIGIKKICMIKKLVCSRLEVR